MSTHLESIRRKVSGERIKELRTELKLTQEQLSNIIGRERSEISKWERGNGTISTETYWRLYDALRSLDVSMDYIMAVKDVRKPQNESIVKELHLSEQAIENIRHEGSKHGDNRYIIMLDHLLSNKEVFCSFMEELLHLRFPFTHVISREMFPQFFSSDGNMAYIKPELLKMMSIDLPDNVFNRMRKTIEDFIESVPDKMIAPNEFDSWDLSDLVDEDEEE